MDRQVISYLKDFFCRPPHQTGDSAAFSAGDFVDLPTFAGKIEQPADPVSAFIKTNLSAPTLAALENYHGKAAEAVSLQTNLLPDLNALIGGQSIYSAPRFSGSAPPPGFVPAVR